MNITNWYTACPLDRVSFGARTIFRHENIPVQKKRNGKQYTSYRQEVVIEFLYDRQAVNGDRDGVRKLTEWVNKTISELKKRIIKEAIYQDSEQQITIDDGVFHMIATPARSYGYLYIGAWMED